MSNRHQASIFPYPQARTIDNVSTQMESQSQPQMPAQLSANYEALINSNSLRMWQRTHETLSFCPKMLSLSKTTVVILPCHLNPQLSRCKAVVIAGVSQVKSMVKTEPRRRVKFSRIETNVSLLSTKSNNPLTSTTVATTNKYPIEASTLNKR